MLGGAALCLAQAPPTATEERLRTRRIGWTDVAPLHARLESHRITAGSFALHVDRLRRTNARRVREGDLDHLVFYLLQSTRFTTLPAIEPAISAKELAATGRAPESVGARAAALLRAFRSSSSADPRLEYFRQLMTAIFPNRRERHAALLREYERVMRFVHEKEFVAQRSERAAEAVAALYRARGLSTDTAVEAGYLVYQGLAVLKSLEPERRIRRVLIVGPGLDLAPRTGLNEEGAPQSYQPWAVIDALLALGLSQAEDLQVVGADINPRVVDHLRRSRLNPPAITLATSIPESDTVALSEDYRSYFARLGRAIGDVEAGSATERKKAIHQKRVQISGRAARVLRAQRLDVVTERLHGLTFDLVIATNILPYFGEVELMLALSNIAAMLDPGGVFLHNEPRPTLPEISPLVGLSFEHSRQAVIATVRGAPGPLVDSVFLHRRRQNAVEK